MIPYGRQDITEADIDAVAKILRSEFLTQGPAVPSFEGAIKSYVGVKHAVAVNSATSALHIACLALGLGPGDRLWTSPITFVASANCGLYCGALVDFVDIDQKTYNLCPKALRAKLEVAIKTAKLPKVLVVVHLSGQSCDMAAIYDLSREFGFRIIEDASHAIGGRYRGQRVGKCEFSDITVFSFHPVKIITTGEGGVAVTNDDALAEKMNLLRSHGITREPKSMVGAIDGSWVYQQRMLGFNYRMTDIQAALGFSQLTRVDNYVARRHRIAEEYNAAFRELPVIVPWQDPDSYSSFHLYIICLRQCNGLDERKRVFDGLRSRGVGVNVHYIPIYRQPFYSTMGFMPSEYPNSEAYYQRAISLPIYPSFDSAKQSQVIDALFEILN